MENRSEQSVYEAIESIRHKNSIARGALEVIRALERRRAKLVIIARDAIESERLDLVGSLCEEGNVPVVFVSSKQALGQFAGLDVGASCVALPVLPP
jgi:ribosomal protein L7Ae-like RNA K-turn-binding protein